MKLKRVPKVLVVDDETELCLLYGHMLRNQGYEVLEAHSGNSAAELIDSARPDLIITDFRMPDGNGIIVIDKAWSENIPVILVSAFAGSIPTSENSTPITVISKPFDFGHLEKVVEEELAKRVRLDRSPGER